MDHLQALQLPSMANFNASFMYCNQISEKQCGGPSKQNYEQRLTKVFQIWKTSGTTYMFFRSGFDMQVFQIWKTSGTTYVLVV
ncbi:hypothetical protein YC2023_072748 [Brassica napus]